MSFLEYPWKFHVLDGPVLIFSEIVHFGEFWPKTTKKQPKIENLTTDPKSIKLAWYVYHLNTFHLMKTVSVN